MFVDSREIHFLDKKNTVLLLDNVSNTKHKVIILIMLDCGLRVSECVSLKLNNFDFKRKEVKVRSLKKRQDKVFRVIPLSDRLYKALADYLYSIKLLHDSYIFPHQSGLGHLRRESVNRFLERYKSNLNIPNLHPHTLRHTCATQHLASGTPLENIKEILGHKKYDTTLIYTHIPSEVLKANIAKVTASSYGFFKRLKNRFFSDETKLINITNTIQNTPTVGRGGELVKVVDLIDRDINTLILGDIGCGKSHLLKYASPEKKVLKLDDTENIKKSLVYLLLYLLDNDKEALKQLLFSDLPLDKIRIKLNRESVKNLCEEINKLVHPKEYILMIDSLDNITPKAIKVLEELKDTFTIIAAARNIPINKSSFLWNFEIIRLQPLERKHSLDLIGKLSYDLEIEDYELFRNHIFEQSNGNPRVIYELIDRYRKEPVISSEVVREIRHFGSLREFDMSIIVILFIACLAILRYVSKEVDNESYRFIGGAAMILLIISRQFFNTAKRKLF